MFTDAEIMAQYQQMDGGISLIQSFTVVTSNHEE